MLLLQIFAMMRFKIEQLVSRNWNQESNNSTFDKKKTPRRTVVELLLALKYIQNKTCCFLERVAKLIRYVVIDMNYT